MLTTVQLNQSTNCSRDGLHLSKHQEILPTQVNVKSLLRLLRSNSSRVLTGLGKRKKIGSMTHQRTPSMWRQSTQMSETMGLGTRQVALGTPMMEEEVKLWPIGRRQAMTRSVTVTVAHTTMITE